MANVADQICDAVEILVNQAIATAGFDKTVTAIIKTCVDKSRGQYRVQTQDSIYLAYAIDLQVEYKAGDSVYVLVPEGNFSSTKEKKILGYADTPSGITYSAAFTEEDKYRNVGDNILLNTDCITDENTGLVSYRKAQYRIKESSVVDGEESVPGESQYSKKYPAGTRYNLLDLRNEDGTEVGCQIDTVCCANNYELADYIKVEANFRTKLVDEQKQGGVYGIEVDIKYVEDEYPTRYILSSNTMTGNPYEYEINNGVRQYGIIYLGVSNNYQSTTGETTYRKTKTIDKDQPITGVYFWEMNFPNVDTKTIAGLQIYYNENAVVEEGKTKYYYVGEDNQPVYLGIEDIDFKKLQAQDKEADLFISDPKIYFCNRIPDDDLNNYYLKSIQPDGNRFSEGSSEESKLNLKAALYYANTLVTPTTNIKYYWGIRDVSITSKDLCRYNKYLGDGWSGTPANPKITYQSFDDANTVMTTFIIEYNNAAGDDKKEKITAFVKSEKFSIYRDYFNEFITYITEGVVTNIVTATVWPETLPTNKSESTDLQIIASNTNKNYPNEYIDSIEWQSTDASSIDNYSTLEVIKKETLSKVTRYKVTAVYNEGSYSLDDIYVYNDDGIDVIIEPVTPKNETFEYNPSDEVTLACTINDLPSEYTGDLKYYWVIKHSNGSTSTLQGNGNEVSFKMSTVKDYATIYCTAYAGDICAGTAEQLIRSVESDKNKVYVTLDNNAQMFKYSTTGVKPNIVIPELKLHLTRANGVEVLDTEIQMIEWWLPNNEIGEGESSPYAKTLLTKTDTKEDKLTEDKVWKIWHSKVETQEGHQVFVHPKTFSYNIVQSYDSSMREYKNILVKIWLKDATNENGLLLDTVETKFEFLKEGEEGTNGTDYSLNIVPWVSDDGIVPNYPIIYVTSKPSVTKVEELAKQLIQHQDRYALEMGLDTVEQFEKDLDSGALTKHYSYKDKLDDGTELKTSEALANANWKYFNDQYESVYHGIPVAVGTASKTINIKNYIPNNSDSSKKSDFCGYQIVELYLKKIISLFLTYGDCTTDEEKNTVRSNLTEDVRKYLTNINYTNSDDVESAMYTSLKIRNDLDDTSYDLFLKDTETNLKYHWNYDPVYLDTIETATTGEDHLPIRFKADIYKHSSGYTSSNFYKSYETDGTISAELEWSIAQMHYEGNISNTNIDESNLKAETYTFKNGGSGNSGLKCVIYDYIFSKYSLDIDALRKAVDEGKTSYWNNTTIQEFQKRQETLSFANVVKLKAVVTDNITNTKTVLYDYLPVIIVDLTNLQLTTEQLDLYKFDISANSLTIQYSNDGKTPLITNQSVDIDIYEGTQEISENDDVLYNWSTPENVIKGEYYDIITDSYGKRGGWTACKNIKYEQHKDKDGVIVNKSSIILMGCSDYNGICQTNQLKVTININGNDVYCYIPVHLYLNTHGNSALNGWDGNSLDINNEGGYILAPIVGAGRKEVDNSFTGMVMGDLQKWKDGTNEVGLFGFSYGERSFYLDAYTGKTIIGRPEDGRIIIDPNRADSCIESSNYQDGIGLKIGLSGGYIYSGGKDKSWRIESDGSFGFGHNKIKYNAVTDELVLGEDVIISYGDGTQGKLNGLSDTINDMAGKAAEDASSAVKTELQGNINAEQKAREEAIESANTQVTQYLTGGGTTGIGENFVISPYIGGGYLYLVDSDTNYIILDPSGLSNVDTTIGEDGVKRGKMFKIAYGGKSLLDVDTKGNLTISGNLHMDNGYISKDGWAKFWGDVSYIKFYDGNNTADNQEVISLVGSGLKFRTGKTTQLVDDTYEIGKMGIDFYYYWKGDTPRSVEDGDIPSSYNVVQTEGFPGLCLNTYLIENYNGTNVNQDMNVTAIGWSVHRIGHSYPERVFFYYNNPHFLPDETIDKKFKQGGYKGFYNRCLLSNCTYMQIGGSELSTDSWYVKDNYRYNTMHNLYLGQCSGIRLVDGEFKTEYHSLYAAGSIYAVNGYSQGSDVRMKNDIKKLKNNNKYNILFDNLSPVSFKYNNDEFNKTHIGFVAQEVEKSVNIAGLSDENLGIYTVSSGDGMMEMSYTEIVGLLVQQVQDLKQKVKELEEKI